jgi:glycosyltransferase involved in cell wall biosynthesis
LSKKTTKKQLRILLFSDPNVDLYQSIAKSLSTFALVRQVDWRYKPLPNGRKYIIFKILYRLLKGSFWFLRIFKEIQKFRADVILVQYANFCGIIGGLTAKLLGRFFVIRTVGSDLKIDTQSTIGAITIRLIFRMASGVICVSEDLKIIAKRLGAKNIIVIPPPLDFPDSEGSGFDKKNNEIITIARLVSIKGMSYLIRAMVHVNGVKLTIVGDGPERTKLESMTRNLKLGDRVSFAGWISNRSELRRFLSQATVFVMPSLSEGIPRVLIEAMSCGLPIVATNVGGIPEFVVDGVNGLLVSPRDEIALAKAIKYVLTDTDFQKRASAENIEAVKHYLPPIVGQRIFVYLEQILAGKE